MNTSPSSDYDRVAYPSMMHAKTFAEALAIKGLLGGLDAAPPDRCRVLELGCGDGFNLAAMAAIHPGASYTGIDYSEETITRGRAMLRELGEAGAAVRLEVGDIRSLDAIAPPPGDFDYIVAHGVYSWTPDDVREALLAAIARRLAPQGVAFVSYLTLPGAHLRELVRTIIRCHTRDIADPTQKAQQARLVLREIAQGASPARPYAQAIAAELKHIESYPDASLYHDELSAISAPVLFTDFLAHAARHGLQFLSEAEYLAPSSTAFRAEARAALQLDPDHDDDNHAARVRLEQYFDFIEGRRLRQTLLCRAGASTRLATGRVAQLWASSRARPRSASGRFADPEPLVFEGRKESLLRATNPLEKALMVELVSRGGAAVRVPELVAAARERLIAAHAPVDDELDAAAHRFLAHAALPGLLDLSWHEPVVALEPTERPHAHPLARWLLRRGASLVPCYFGYNVEITGALGRKLVTLLDGTRDGAALLAEMRRFLTTERAFAKASGARIELPSPDDPAIPDQLERSVQGLAGLGLLRR